MACTECGGGSGHTIRCPKGPGPADAPTPADVLGAAAALEWPELRAGRYFVAGNRASWVAAVRLPRPERLRALFEALEEYERRWRAEAPTLVEVAP